MESRMERERGKSAEPGSARVPIGSLIEREKTKTPTKRKNKPPMWSFVMVVPAL
jgi:hypothetical protein